jgi:hypothetical protein
MNVGNEVTAHYRHGNLEQAFFAALVAMGKDPARLNPAILWEPTSFTLAAPRRQLI